MSISDHWPQTAIPVSSPADWVIHAPAVRIRQPGGSVPLWMFADFLTVLAAAAIATISEHQISLIPGQRSLYDGTLWHGRPVWILLGLLFGFAISVVVGSHRFRLYAPNRIGSILHEQRLTIGVCFICGFLLTGTLYLVPWEGISRRIVILTLFIVTILLCARRFIHRSIMHRRFERGRATRNVLIVGTGPQAHALRHHLDSIRDLGYTFKGFIDVPGSISGIVSRKADVVGQFDTVFQDARQHFVDEILIIPPCDRRVILEAVEKARMVGIDLRVVPDLYEGLRWNKPIEFIGEFPTIPLHREKVPKLGFFFKRVIDILFSALVLLLISPFFIAIAIAISLESSGPVFYRSQRIGKRGRVFRCYKFRTMVPDAEKRRTQIMHMNERDGVLFKISKDPRTTRLGRILRKYSLDELPQFINVLKGNMSVVGPRPPIASEVMEYSSDHLRRLDVMPGITGLWQVQARQDPSFENYVSLDCAYIENWSVWLDLKIILRTIGVVASGTGT